MITENREIEDKKRWLDQILDKLNKVVLNKSKSLVELPADISIFAGV